VSTPVNALEYEPDTVVLVRRTNEPDEREIAETDAEGVVRDDDGRPFQEEAYEVEMDFQDSPGLRHIPGTAVRVDHKRDDVESEALAWADEDGVVRTEDGKAFSNAYEVVEVISE